MNAFVLIGTVDLSRDGSGTSSPTFVALATKCAIANKKTLR